MSEGYTVKEMLNRVIDQNEKALVTQTELLERARNVDDHLNKLNSKVAKHVLDIQDLKDEHRNVKSYATAISVIFGIFITFVNFVIK